MTAITNYRGNINYESLAVYNFWHTFLNHMKLKFLNLINNRLII